MSAEPHDRDPAQEEDAPGGEVSASHPDPAEPGSEDKDLRHRDERLRDLVDGMEQDVEEERREDDAPGNVDERERTSSVEPDDQAPT